jgi:hypothetical protein
MAKRKATIGSPSLPGKDEPSVIEKSFPGEKFPVNFRLTNNTLHPMSFPDVNAYLPNNLTPDDGNSKVVLIKTADHFQRLVSDIQRLSVHYKWTDAVTIEETVDLATEPAPVVEVPPVPPIEIPVAKEATAAAAEKSAADNGTAAKTDAEKPAAETK